MNLFERFENSRFNRWMEETKMGQIISGILCFTMAVMAGVLFYGLYIAIWG